MSSSSCSGLSTRGRMSSLAAVHSSGIFRPPFLRCTLTWSFHTRSRTAVETILSSSSRCLPRRYSVVIPAAPRAAMNASHTRHAMSFTEALWAFVLPLELSSALVRTLEVMGATRITAATVAAAVESLLLSTAAAAATAPAAAAATRRESTCLLRTSTLPPLTLTSASAVTVACKETVGLTATTAAEASLTGAGAATACSSFSMLISALSSWFVLAVRIPAALAASCLAFSIAASLCAIIMGTAGAVNVVDALGAAGAPAPGAGGAAGAVGASDGECEATRTSAVARVAVTGSGFTTPLRCPITTTTSPSSSSSSFLLISISDPSPAVFVPCTSHASSSSSSTSALFLSPNPA
mmetsp:Transcript_32507/g.81881  ORF Transcript_32507/g.81881 Transcript_32507/m.81881 type:complete len:353 (-) Transcript_32507:78-1136(-)